VSTAFPLYTQQQTYGPTRSILASPWAVHTNRVHDLTWLPRATHLIYALIKSLRGFNRSGSKLIESFMDKGFDDPMTRGRRTLDGDQWRRPMRNVQAPLAEPDGKIGPDPLYFLDSNILARGLLRLDIGDVGLRLEQT